MSIIYAIHLLIVIIYISGVFVPGQYVLYWIWFALIIGLNWFIFGDCILNKIEHRTLDKTPNFVGRVLRSMGIDLTEVQAENLVFYTALVFLAIFVYKYIRWKNITSSIYYSTNV